MATNRRNVLILFAIVGLGIVAGSIGMHLWLDHQLNGIEGGIEQIPKIILVAELHENRWLLYTAGGAFGAVIACILAGLWMLFTGWGRIPVVEDS